MNRETDEVQANKDNEAAVAAEAPVFTYPRSYFRLNDATGVVIRDAVQHKTDFPEYTYLNPLDFGMETAPAAKEA